MSGVSARSLWMSHCQIRLTTSWLPQKYNPWARTSQGNGVKLRNKFPPPNRCTFVKINVRDPWKYTVRHSSIQVHSGSERNQIHHFYHIRLGSISESIAISFCTPNRCLHLETYSLDRSGFRITYPIPDYSKQQSIFPVNSIPVL